MCLKYFIFIISLTKFYKIRKVVKMIAHPIIEAIISTLKDKMPSHMESGTA